MAVHLVTTISQFIQVKFNLKIVNVHSSENKQFDVCGKINIQRFDLIRQLTSQFEHFCFDIEWGLVARWQANDSLRLAECEWVSVLAPKKGRRMVMSRQVEWFDVGSATHNAIILILLKAFNAWTLCSVDFDNCRLFGHLPPPFLSIVFVLSFINFLLRLPVKTVAFPLVHRLWSLLNR